MTASTETSPNAGGPAKKPRLAYAIGTALGIGYAPKAPGTFGSLVGVATAMLTALLFLRPSTIGALFSGHPLADAMLKENRFLVPGADIHNAALGLPLAGAAALLAFLSAVGVWSCSRVAEHSGAKDPQFVVIDEVAGQYLTLILPLIPMAMPHVTARMDFSQYVIFSALSLLNWKYLLAGFILFRVFDIFKPFPVRQLEKLRSGWGIMADDWMAGIYAAIVLRLALHFILA